MVSVAEALFLLGVCESTVEHYVLPPYQVLAPQRTHCFCIPNMETTVFSTTDIRRSLRQRFFEISVYNFCFPITTY